MCTCSLTVNTHVPKFLCLGQTAETILPKIHGENVIFDMEIKGQGHTMVTNEYDTLFQW